MTEKKKPWIPFYPSDWLAGTRGMSAAETGIYITLISMMYEHQAPLKYDNSRLSRLCGASNSSFKRALEALIEDGKIEKSDEGLWNERVGRELFYKREKSSVASQSANARWKKDKQKQRPPDANALRTHCERNASHSHSQNSSKTTDSAASSPHDQSAAADAIEISKRCLNAMGIDHRDPTWTGNYSWVMQWLANGWDVDLDIIPTIERVMARRNGQQLGLPNSLNFFTKAIAEAHQSRLNSAENVVQFQPDKRRNPPNICADYEWSSLAKQFPDAGERVVVDSYSLSKETAIFFLRRWFIDREKLGPRAQFRGFRHGRLDIPPGHPESVWPDELVDEAKTIAQAEISNSQQTTG